MRQLKKPIVLKEWKLFLMSATVIVICALIFIQFLKFHEPRIAEMGLLFNDPFFNFISAKNVSLFIFILTYGSVVLYITLNYNRSKQIPTLMVAYGILLLFRIVSMSLVPLKQPDDIVFLQDPFLNNFIYPGKIETDLFFSGHCGLVLSMFFINTKNWIFLIILVILGYLLMVQRVHYSIDIFGAIPFAFIAVWISKKIIKLLDSLIVSPDINSIAK